MRYIFPVKLIGQNCRSCRKSLVVFWCVGLICGIFTAAGAGNLSSLMRACCHSRVSIVGLMFVPTLPFLFSAVAVYFSFPRLLYPIGFLKAFSFGFCLQAVSSAFGSAGWLMRFLLLFTNCMTIPVLCWFWLRHVDGNTGNWIRDTLICCGLFLITAILDHSWITPLVYQII